MEELPDLSCCFVNRVPYLGRQLRNWVEEQAVQHRLNTHTERKKLWKMATWSQSLSVVSWFCFAPHILSVPGASPQGSGLQTVRSSGSVLRWFTVNLWCLIGWDNWGDFSEVEALIKHPIHQLGKDRERCRGERGGKLFAHSFSSVTPVLFDRVM